MSKLNLDGFFISEKSSIIMFFNEQSIKNLFNSKNSFESSLHYFFFLLHNKKKEKYSLLKRINKQTCFSYKNKDVDLIKINSIIKNVYNKWIFKTKIPFPDIVFSHPKKGKASFGYSSFNESNGVIWLSADLLLDYTSLEFSICHELGHIYYNNNEKHKIDKKISLKNYIKHKYNLIVLISFLMQIPGIYHLILSKDIPFYLKFAVLISFSFIMIYVELGSFFSYKDRIKNYSQEFFSDTFVGFFLGKKINEKDIFPLINELKINCYTHPKDFLRRKSLKINQERSIKHWDNIALTESSMVRPNYYELHFFWKKNYILLKNKIIFIFSFLNKKIR